MTQTLAFVSCGQDPDGNTATSVGAFATARSLIDRKARVAVLALSHTDQLGEQASLADHLGGKATLSDTVVQLETTGEGSLFAVHLGLAAEGPGVDLLRLVDAIGALCRKWKLDYLLLETRALESEVTQLACLLADRVLVDGPVAASQMSSCALLASFSDELITDGVLPDDFSTGWRVN